MSNEIKNAAAIELSEQELDIVAGGTSQFPFSGLSGSSFEQVELFAGEATFAGPGGAGTTASLQLGQITSGSFQGIEFGN